MNLAKSITYIEFADSSIDGSIQGTVELHCEGIGGLFWVSFDPVDDSSQLLYIVQHHLNPVFNWILHNLQGKKKRVISRGIPLPVNDGKYPKYEDST